MVDTRRTLAELITLYADNASADISAQDGRDMLKTMYGGGLELNDTDVTASDITGAVGQLYNCTIADLTANRNLILPAGAVDERIGVHIVDGDASFELIIKGDTGISINGGTAATEWSRVFIAGETVILRATSVTNWIVEHDGRIPCTASLSAAADQAISNNTWTGADFNIGEDDWDVGDIFDDTIDTNAGGFNLRRAGKYAVTMYSDFDALEDSVIGGMSLRIDGTQDTAQHRTNMRTGGAGTIRYGNNRNVELTAAAGGTVGMMLYKTFSGSGNGNCQPHLSIHEVGIGSGGAGGKSSLEIVNETVTTSDVTGVANTHHVCTIAGLTADRNLTLPSASAGDRVMVSIVDGDPTYELIIKGAASQTINGGSAATEWSRLFIIGESATFVCTAANTWIVEQDGRIPCSAKMHRNGTNQTLIDATNDQVEFTTVSYDTGDVASTANNEFTARRAGRYQIIATARPDDVFATNQVFYLFIRDDAGATNLARRAFYPSVNSVWQSNLIVLTVDAAVADVFEMWININFASATELAGAEIDTNFCLIEIL